MPTSRLPAVDTYIASARPFAQPLLTHLRETIHRAAPDTQEAIKWSMPFFLYKGIILGNMAAFKEHASFGLWGREVVDTLREGGVASGGTMGSFGRLTSISDLPPTQDLEGYIREAAALIDEGIRTKSIHRIAKPGRPAPTIPEALTQAFQTNPVAGKKFAALSPSCRREYAEWIADAKREETRAKRVATAIEWIAEGKNRNWKQERSA